MREKLKVCWISAGVSSFIAGWLVRDSVDIYILILKINIRTVCGSFMTVRKRWENRLRFFAAITERYQMSVVHSDLSLPPMERNARKF